MVVADDIVCIDVKINGEPVRAVILEQSKVTVLSESAAQRCRINRLVVEEHSSVPLGRLGGTQLSIGRIRLYPIKLGGLFLPASFRIVKHLKVDLVIGEDFRERYRCRLDFEKMALIIDNIGCEIPFHILPKGQ